MIIRIEKDRDLSHVVILYLISLVLLTLAFWLNNEVVMLGLMGFLFVSMLLLSTENALLFMMMIISFGDMITLSRNYTTSMFGVILVAFVIKNFIHLRIKSKSSPNLCVNSFR